MLKLKISKARSARLVSGFTLLEVLLSVAIIVAISGAMVALFTDVFSANTFLRESFFTQREVSSVIRDMIQEIRTAGPSSVGGYLLEKTDPSSIAFYTNVDKDATKERVQYFLSGTNLKKSIVKPAGSPLTYATTTASESLITVLTGVVASTTAPLFSYFDKNYAGTSSPLTVPINILSVRLVRVTIITDKSSSDKIPPTSVSSDVEIRNLKYVQ